MDNYFENFEIVFFYYITPHFDWCYYLENIHNQQNDYLGYIDYNFGSMFDYVDIPINKKQKKNYYKIMNKFIYFIWIENACFDHFIFPYLF